MSKVEETIAAILRRYREFVAADFPPAWPFAGSFADLHKFAQDPHDDRRMEHAAMAVRGLFRVASQPRPSLKSTTRILSAIAEVSQCVDFLRDR